jgi:hypothetical protein
MTASIVTARKELEREGWDNGAWSIHSRLRHDGVDGVPSARTICQRSLNLGSGPLCVIKSAPGWSCGE